MIKPLLLAALLIAYVALILFIVVPEASAHARYVYLHNHNDAGWVNSAHNTLVACDGTDNGDTFGVQGRTRSGRVVTLWDDGPGQSCNVYNPGSVGHFQEIRWIEDVGSRARDGQWRDT